MNSKITFKIYTTFTHLEITLTKVGNLCVEICFKRKEMFYLLRIVTLTQV